MKTSSVVHTALDGSQVEIASPQDLASPFTSVLVASVAGRQLELTCGTLQFGEDVATEFGVVFTEEYLFQGGRLRVGGALLVDPLDGTGSTLSLGLWDGDVFSLEFGFYDGQPDDVIKVLDQFKLSEVSSGLTLQPADSSLVVIESALGRQPVLLKQLPNVGHLEVCQLTKLVAESVPNWPGYPVEGGELYIQESLPDRPLFVVVGETSLARLFPDDWVDESKVVDALSETTVDWVTV